MELGDRVLVNRHGERFAGTLVGKMEKSGKRRAMVHEDGTVYISFRLMSERYITLDLSSKSAQSSF